MLTLGLMPDQANPDTTPAGASLAPTLTAAALVIDHSAILAADLEIALANAARDPDGQVYPWRAGYPLIGSTVFCAGELWTIIAKERGPGEDKPTAIFSLAGCGDNDRTAILVTRSELRPVTWTQDQEDAIAELDDGTECGCGAPSTLLVPAETFGYEGAPVHACDSCADAAIDAALAEVVLS